jgi:thiol-disulfide isomerase/thioredoxin
MQRFLTGSMMVMAAAITIVIGMFVFGESAIRGEEGNDLTRSATPSGTPPGGWQSWQTMELTDARTGEPFALADFHGRTIHVQPMATWCGACRQQLTNIQEALATTDPEGNVVFVAISVETDLDPATLGAYSETLGFDWPFAVASPDMLWGLVDEFGRTLANPPATPHFVIRPDGSFTELETGIQTPGELAEWIASSARE